MNIKNIAVYLLCASVMTSSLAMASDVQTTKLQEPVAAEFVVQAKNDQGMTASQYKEDLKLNIQDMKQAVEGYVFEMKSASGNLRVKTSQDLVHSLAVQNLFEKELVNFEKTGEAITKSDFSAQLGKITQDAYGTKNMDKIEPLIQSMIKYQDANRPSSESGIHPNNVRFQQYLKSLEKEDPFQAMPSSSADSKGISVIDAHDKLSISSQDLVNPNEVGSLFRNAIDMIKAQDGQSRTLDSSPTLG